MRIDHPTGTAPLRRLWKAAFGDTDAFLDLFFRYGYDPQCCRCITENGETAAALYWLDCTYMGNKIAYLYAIATLESHRGKGLCRALMEDVHALLKAQGYAGAMLVPASNGLFSMYEKMGYHTVSTMDSFTCRRGNPIPIKKLTPAEYAHLRRQYLPENGVIQEGRLLSFLSSYSDFYAGEDFLLAGYPDEGIFQGSELLGNAAAAEGILGALGMEEGNFRTPGTGQPFAMCHPLTDAPVPGYLGLALD